MPKSSEMQITGNKIAIGRKDRLFQKRATAKSRGNGLQRYILYPVSALLFRFLNIFYIIVISATMKEISIKPVSWTDGNVNKYQAMVRFTEKPRERVICGEPRNTMKAALDALDTEIRKWKEVLKESKISVDRYREEHNMPAPPPEKKTTKKTSQPKTNENEKTE